MGTIEQFPGAKPAHFTAATPGVYALLLISADAPMGSLVVLPVVVIGWSHRSGVHAEPLMIEEIVGTVIGYVADGRILDCNGAIAGVVGVESMPDVIAELVRSEAHAEDARLDDSIWLL